MVRKRILWALLAALAVVGVAPEGTSFIGASRAIAQRPVIERISPSSGPPGTQVSVVGRNIASTTQFFIGGAQAQVISRSPLRWTIEVPAGAQSGSIVLRNSQGDFAGPYFRVSAALAAPVVHHLEPAAGLAGSAVTIHGQNFSSRLSDNTVTLNGRPVVIRGVTPTSLSVIVPPGANSGAFVVSVRGRGSVQTPVFTVSAGLAITSVDPVAAPVGSQVVLRGTGFSPVRRNNRVYLNNRPVRVVGATPTELTVVVPRRAANAPFLVDVRGGQRTQSATVFQVQERPRVRDVSPASGAPGALVTIRGSAFGSDVGVVQVTLGGVACPIRSVLPNQLEVQIPDTANTANFEVRVHALSAVAPRPFTVLGNLNLTGFTPRSGGPGSTITLNGSGFSAVPSENQVFLGTTQMPVVSATVNQLQVQVPQAPSGRIQVQVQGAATLSRQPFVVTNPPVIADFQPRFGPVGTQVTITGSNFGNRSSRVRATLNGLTLPVRSASANQVVVEIPRRARSGRITVNVGTQGGTITPVDFVVEANRQAMAATPSTGYIGTEVTIRGQNFPRSGITVQFTGAAPVPVQRISPVEIRAIVPRGAQTGPVNVVLGNTRVMPAGTFSVTATPSGTAITSIVPQCAYTGCRATLQGYGFSPRANQNRVRFNGQRVRVERATPTSLEIFLPGQPGNGQFELRVRRGGRATSPPFLVIQRR